MRVLVCGGRDFADTAKVFTTLDQIAFAEPGANWPTITQIIHGGARGADTLAGAWAKAWGIPCREFAITSEEWDQHGKRAGYLRNKRMLDEGKPHLVVALSGGRGTAMMVKLSRDAGVKVIEVA